MVNLAKRILQWNALPQQYKNRIKKIFGKKAKRLYIPILKKAIYHNNYLQLQGYIFIPQENKVDLKHFTLKLLKFRQESITHTIPLSLEPLQGTDTSYTLYIQDSERFRDMKVFTFEIELPFSIISNYNGIFNILFDYRGKTRHIQSHHGSPPAKEYTHIYEQTMFNFYLDDVYHIWRFDIYQMSHEEFNKLDQLQAQSDRDPNVWLIGEYTISARDNGMHFYHYMLHNHPSIEAYYVIDRESDDIKNLDKSRIVYYGSYKHFELASRAKVLIFTHLADYLIPKIDAITSYSNRYENYFKVFLQHGVTGPTRISRIARKELRKYNFVNATSNFEAEIFKKYLGYTHEISINGFPRWDILYREKKFTKDMLLIPTHRENLWRVSDESFLTSSYYLFWSSLLNNDKLITYIEEKDIKIHFFLHIILSRFAKHFSSPSKNIIFSNDKDIQSLLLECGALVTDYSSVAFDALYQNKPAIYAPFDYREMMKRRGGEPFIDYERDLPGPLCYTVDDLVNAIISTDQNDWKIEGKFLPRVKKFFTYIDENNSERVYLSIKDKLSTLS